MNPKATTKAHNTMTGGRGRHRLAAAMIACLALAFGLAACGGGGGTTATSAETTPAGSSGGGGGGGGQKTIAVQETAGVPSAFVQFGIDKGFFSDHGLKIDLTAAQGGAATLPALISGNIQIGGSNVVSLLLAKSKGLPIEIIAPGTSASGKGEKDFGPLMVAKDSSIKSLKDLEGKTVATNTLNNIVVVVVNAAAEKQGVDVSKIKYSEVPFPEMATALKNGDVDAAFVIEPFGTAALGEGDKIISYPYVETQPHLQVGAYAATESYVKDNPDVIKNYQAAVAQDAAYIDSHQAEFRKFLAERAKIPAALAKKMVLPNFTAKVNVASLQRLSDLMHKYGISKTTVQAADMVAPGAGQ